MKKFLILMGILSISSFALARDNNIDTGDNSAPIVGPDKVRIAAHNPRNAISGPQVGKASRLTVSLDEKVIKIDLSVPNKRYMYEIRAIDDSTVELRIQNCAARSCGDFGKQKIIGALSNHFILRVLQEGNMAGEYKVDVKDKKLTIQILKENPEIVLLQKK